MTLKSRIVWIAAPAAAVLLVDRLTKNLAIDHLAGNPPRDYAGGAIRLLYDENPGVFLGLGAALPETSRFWVFTFFVGVVLAGLLAYLLFRREISRGEVAAFSLIIGGGVGNLIDRLMYDGVVIDFLNIGIGSLRTGVFNAADASVVAGVLFYFLVQAYASRRPEGPRENPPTANGGT
jgi:signal peptidase II